MPDELQSTRVADGALAVPLAGTVNRPGFDAIPHQLKQRRQWVTYRLVFPQPFPDDGSIQLLPLKPRKHPFDAKTGKPASELDPVTWSTFDEACAAMTADGYHGIGFVFSKTDPFVGIDLDFACYPSHLVPVEPNGESLLAGVKRWAVGIVHRHAPRSYVEISQSQVGLHIICRGKLPGTGGKRLVFDPAGEIVGQIEMYDRNKFFAVTGHAVRDGQQQRLLRGDQREITRTYETFGFDGRAPQKEARYW